MNITTRILAFLFLLVVLSPGLGLVSLLYGVAGSNWTAIAMLCGVAALTPLVVLLGFPETSGRRLEEIAPDA